MTVRRERGATGRRRPAQGSPLTDARGLATLRGELEAELSERGIRGEEARAALDAAAVVVCVEAHGGAGEADGVAVEADGPVVAPLADRLRAAGFGSLPVETLGAWSELGRGTGADARGEARRAQGAWYTPPALARLVVDLTLGEGLRARRARWGLPGGEAPLSRWKSWRAELTRLRVVDPACGAGAFLLPALTTLREALAEADAAMAALGEGAPPHDPIGQLYGCDLDPQALVVARAALRLAADAASGSEAPSPHLTIGDALAPLAGPPWRGGRFDVVLGNPPFVRHERLVGQKDRLRGFATFDAGADLFVFFVERAHDLLAPGGRLGLVLPDKWLRAGYAGPLRAWLARRATVERLVDFGHAPLFPGADAFPSILVARRRSSPGAAPPPVAAPPPLAATPPTGAPLTRAAIDAASFPLTLPSSGQPWALVPPALAAVFGRMTAAGRPLPQYAGVAPLYGIKTGCNDAFLVDTATRDALVAADPGCAPVLRPYLRGQDCGAWAPSPPREWILALRSSTDHAWPWTDAPDPEATFRATFPALAAHLAPLAERLRRRVDQGRYWWELRGCRYYDAFERPRLAWPDLCWTPSFAWSRDPMWADNTVYVLPCEDPWLVAVLHAPATWVWLWHHAVHGKDEVLRLKSPTVSALPVPLPSPAQRALAATLVPQLQAGPDERAQAALAVAVHDALGLTPEDRAALRVHAPPRGLPTPRG